MKIKTAHRKISSPAIVCLHAKSKGTTTATAKKNMNNMVFMKCKTHPNGKKCGNDVMWWEYNIYAVANENTKRQLKEWSVANGKMNEIKEREKERIKHNPRTSTTTNNQWNVQARNILFNEQRQRQQPKLHTTQTHSGHGGGGRKSYAKQHFSVFSSRFACGQGWYSKSSVWI